MNGIGVDFSTRAPISLYGSTKLASEVMALEYGEAFDFPVWITRCGVLAGAGQFGTPDQGIFSLLDQRAPAPPAAALHRLRRHGQADARRVSSARSGGSADRSDADVPARTGSAIYTAGGGPANAMSLAQLTAWCDERFGAPCAGRRSASRAPTTSPGW